MRSHRMFYTRAFSYPICQYGFLFPKPWAKMFCEFEEVGAVLLHM